AYEKRVETALFKFERLIGEEDRTDYDEVAAAARDHVNVRREILELTEEQRQLEKDDRVQAADASREGMSGETDRDDARRLSTESERDDANARWDAAVARHGEDVVERANDLLIEIEAARERIDRAQDEGRSTEAAEVNYVQALNTAAELATAGNSYMREVAERDEDLRRAVSEAERAGGGKGAATSADAGVDERNRDATGAEHRSDIVDEQADHDIAAHANPEARRASRSDRERDTSPRSGDASRTDPAQQHVPRLEELEREAREQKDRDRDDFER
ncbi:MAG: conjugal transfer protein TraA, partial [Rhizobiaceae bacterium]